MSKLTSPWEAYDIISNLRVFMKFTIRRGPNDILLHIQIFKTEVAKQCIMSLSLSLSLKREARGTKKRLNPVNRRDQHRNYLRFFHNQAATLITTGQYCLNLSLSLQSHLIYVGMYCLFFCVEVGARNCNCTSQVNSWEPRNGLLFLFNFNIFEPFF